MGVLTYESEVTTSIPPEKLFNAFVLDGGNIIPKAMAGAIESVVLVEGDGGPGSMKQVKFGKGTGFNYVKERVEKVDKENLIYAYTMVEGDVLMDTFEKIFNEVKFEAAPDGGCLIKGSSEYHTVGDKEVNEEAIKDFKAKQMGVFKAIEGLLKNEKGVLTCEMDTTTSIPPAKLFKAFVIDGKEVIPKAAPEAIESMVIVEGDGGPGTIRQVNFKEGTGFKYVKERFDVIEEENFRFGYTMIEGDVLMDTFEKIFNEVKFEATPEGGCVCKGSSKYYLAGENQINEEAIQDFKEKQMGIFKAIEAYLLANPDA